MRDLASLIHLLPAFAPKAAVTDGTAQVSSTCDRKGYHSVVLAFILGTLTDADAVWSVLIEESDDDSTYTAVDDKDLNGTEVLAGFTFADDGECRKIGYTGSKRYIKATIDDTTANTGNLFLAGMWIMGRAESSPTPNPPS